MIRKAKLSDLVSVLEIIKACATHMINNNIYQWNAHYPNAEAFKNDINRNELYVLELNNKLIGCVVLSTIMDQEYKPVKWGTKNTNNLYIHRLAVHPKQQKKGHAQALMAFAENDAVNNNYTSIRLDTFSKNVRNQKFYELRNYNRLGSIFFPKQSKAPFYCYEKVL